MFEYHQRPLDNEGMENWGNIKWDKDTKKEEVNGEQEEENEGEGEESEFG